MMQAPPAEAAGAPAAPTIPAAKGSGSQLLRAALGKIDLSSGSSANSTDSGLIAAFRNDSCSAANAASDSESCGASSGGAAGGRGSESSSCGERGSGDGASSWASFSATAAASAAGPPAAAPAARAAPAAAVTARPKSHTKLLALCPTVPPSMQRECWCMADYEVLAKLYTGYASKVYKAICKRTREVVVLKSYQLSAICELYQHQIFREVALHASLTHENVVALYAAFQEGDFVVMVQEFADGGDLFSLLQKYGGRLSERVTVSLVLEPFLRVLQYLHTRGIVHRDIKPENILFSSGMCLKLADFGLAIDLRQERAVTRAGTLDYMAPEVLNCPYKNRPDENKEKTHLHYGSTVDSWAVGVLAYELLVGCPPFYDQTRDRVEARIRAAQPSFPRTMTDDARVFIAGALTKDPRARPTVLQLLHHPWVNTFRARRSMRQLAAAAVAPAPAGAQAPAAAPAPPAAEDAAAAAAAASAAASAAAAKAAAAKAKMAAEAASSGSPCSSPRGAQGSSSASSSPVATPRARKVAVLMPEDAPAATASPRGGQQAPPAQSPSSPSSPQRGGRALQSSPSGKHLSGASPSSSSSQQTPFESVGIAGSHRPLKLSSSLAAKKAPAAGGPAAGARSAASSSSSAPDSLRVMASAKSSPLMMAGDLRGLGLRGVGAAVPQAGDAGGAATGERQRKKWLQNIRLWPNGPAAK